MIWEQGQEWKFGSLVWLSRTGQPFPFTLEEMVCSLSSSVSNSQTPNSFVFIVIESGTAIQFPPRFLGYR